MAIDLSKQIELENLDLTHEINFIGRLEEDNATMFLISEKKEETTSDFSQILELCLICIKMETRKIVNLLNGSDNESSNSQQENGKLLMTKTMDNMAMEMKMVQPLN